MPNPQSAIRIPHSGITLAEVLISMGIMAVGLLGVAAMFPVGGHYMQTADVVDRAGAIATAALDDAIVRGHLDPRNWVVHNPMTAANFTLPGAALFTDLITGEGTTSVGALNPAFNRAGLRAALTTGTAQQRSRAFGDAFVIDPLGLATGLGDPSVTQLVVTNPQTSMPFRTFPAIAANSDFGSSFTPAWTPWIDAAAPLYWPVRRVTTVHSERALTTFVAGTVDSVRLQELESEAYFSSGDDMALVPPEKPDLPARGRWSTWGDSSLPVPLASARQARGDFSWLISVSPGSSAARDALATQPDAFQYDVSTVVFHKRVLGRGAQGLREAERLVRARVVTTGTAGGELLLERRLAAEDPVTTSPFADLRTGEYVMLTGPHPLSAPDRPMLFLQWYRVLSIEDQGAPSLPGLTSAVNRRLSRDGDGSAPEKTARVLVSLRGPDWPWRPTGDLSQAALANDLRVAIVPGAVAVHTKTMRLESGSAWQAD